MGCRCGICVWLFSTYLKLYETEFHCFSNRLRGSWRRHGMRQLYSSQVMYFIDFLQFCSRSVFFKVPRVLHSMHKKDKPRHDKTNKVAVRPAKTQISLGIRPIWSESSPCAQWVAKDPICFHADSEDSDQTGRMHRLIWVFAGRTLTLLVLSWGGSFVLLMSDV